MMRNPIPYRVLTKVHAETTRKRRQSCLTKFAKQSNQNGDHCLHQRCPHIGCVQIFDQWIVPRFVEFFVFGADHQYESVSPSHVNINYGRVALGWYPDEGLSRHDEKKIKVP